MYERIICNYLTSVGLVNFLLKIRTSTYIKLIGVLVFGLASLTESNVTGLSK